MLLQAVADLRLDPARCAILGDKMSDMEAAPPPVSVCGFSSDRAMRSRTRRRPRTKWSLILRKRSPSCDLTLSRLRLTTYEQYRCEPLATRIEGNLADQGQAEFSAIQIARSRSDVD
jgi:hypothetical protein